MLKRGMVVKSHGNVYPALILELTATLVLVWWLIQRVDGTTPNLDQDLVQEDLDEVADFVHDDYVANNDGKEPPQPLFPIEAGKNPITPAPQWIKREEVEKWAMAEEIPLPAIAAEFAEKVKREKEDAKFIKR